MHQSLISTVALLQGALIAAAPIVVDPPGPVGPIGAPILPHGPIVHPDGTVIGRDVSLEAGADIPVVQRDTTAQVDASGNIILPRSSTLEVGVDGSDASASISRRQDVTVEAGDGSVDGSISARHVITPGEHVHVPGPHNDVWVPPVHDKREVIQGPVIEPGKPGPDVVQGPVVSPAVGPGPVVSVAPREVIQGPVIEPGKPGPDVVQGPVISPAVGPGPVVSVAPRDVDATATVGVDVPSVTVAPRAVISHAVWEHVPGPDNNILISAPVVEPGVPQHAATPVAQ